jgi:threonine dehydratase
MRVHNNASPGTATFFSTSTGNFAKACALAAATMTQLL